MIFSVSPTVFDCSIVWPGCMSSLVGVVIDRRNRCILWFECIAGCPVYLLFGVPIGSCPVKMSTRVVSVSVVPGLYVGIPRFTISPQGASLPVLPPSDFYPILSLCTVLEGRRSFSAPRRGESGSKGRGMSAIPRRELDAFRVDRLILDNLAKSVNKAGQVLLVKEGCELAMPRPSSLLRGVWGPLLPGGSEVCSGHFSSVLSFLLFVTQSTCHFSFMIHGWRLKTAASGAAGRGQVLAPRRNAGAARLPEYASQSVSQFFWKLPCDFECFPSAPVHHLRLCVSGGRVGRTAGVYAALRRGRCWSWYLRSLQRSEWYVYPSFAHVFCRCFCFCGPCSAWNNVLRPCTYLEWAMLRLLFLSDYPLQ